MIQKIKRLARHLSLPSKHDVMFYASHSVDEMWIRSTILLANRSGLNVIFCCGGNIPHDIETLYKTNGIKTRDKCYGILLKKILSKIVVTASSGIKKSAFSHCVLYLVHMPHSISSLHMIYPKEAFDEYDILFSVGPHHDREMISIASRRALTGFKKSIPTGYGKLDLLQDAAVNKKMSSPFLSGKTVLIAPSWGQGNILDTMDEKLILALLDRDLNVTLRPHPMFFINNASAMEHIRSRFSKNARFSIESSMELGEALFYADILITDYSGIAQEFSALRKKPVIFVDVPRKILNSEWEEHDITPLEIESYGHLGPLVEANSDAITEKTILILDSVEDWQQSISAFRSSYLHHDRCAPNALSAIESLLRDTPE